MIHFTLSAGQQERTRRVCKSHSSIMIIFFKIQCLLPETALRSSQLQIRQSSSPSALTPRQMMEAHPLLDYPPPRRLIEKNLGNNFYSGLGGLKTFQRLPVQIKCLRLSLRILTRNHPRSQRNYLTTACLKERSFLNLWNVSSILLVLENAGVRLSPRLIRILGVIIKHFVIWHTGLL